MITVICHFHNEPFFLPQWLKHHRQMFDHGIMIDHNSTDNSTDIIRAICPTWDIITHPNPEFDSVENDEFIKTIELTVTDWKTVLNVTEFLLCKNLRHIISQTSANFIVATGIEIYEPPEKLGAPQQTIPIYQQYTFGNFNNRFRARITHCKPHGHYGPGRHTSNFVKNAIAIGELRHSNTEVFCAWFGMCPLAEKETRNKARVNTLSESDERKGWYTHGRWIEEELVNEYKQAIGRSYDLKANRPDSGAASLDGVFPPPETYKHYTALLNSLR